MISSLRNRQAAWGVGTLAATIFTISCQGRAGFANLQEQLAQISDKQDTTMAALDALEGKIGQARPARPGGNAAKPQARAGQPDPNAIYKVTVDDAITKGPSTAKVTIVEWSDFQCPFCNRVGPTLAQLEKDYGTDLRIAFKHNPLPMHDRALPGALAAEAAGRQGKFWEMHDLLFANGRALTDENFEKWAGEIGIDGAKFKQDMADPALKKKVEVQQRQGMSLGARGTPAFFINGRFLSGAQPVDAFKKVIDEEMKRADKLLAAGTPANKVYDEAIERGKDKV
jgi:protein-disulfide isomerase